MAPAMPSVLVIGGGYAGVNAAKALKGVATVTVVDKKEYFDISVAAVRSVVDLKVAASTAVLYKDLKNLGTFIQGSVVELSARSAKLADGQVLQFDFCVIAVGSSYAASWAKAEEPTHAGRTAEMQANFEAIKAAKNIVVIGGGPVGVETAAEILEAYAGKKVTLVTPGSTLLEEKTKLAGNALKWLQAKGCTVIFNDRVEELPESLPCVLRTKTGKELPADYVIKAYGTTVHTEFAAGVLGASILPRGLIKVNANLQVEGHDHMWALGDCNSVAETKLAYLAGMQGKLVAKNIAAVIGGKKQTAWKLYGGMPAMFVSLGRNSGVGMLGSCVCPGFMVASMKSKDLFVTKLRAEIME